MTKSEKNDTELLLEIAKEVGFVNVTTKNLTTTFKQILSEEKTRLIEEKSDFLQVFYFYKAI